ncbi:MAG: 16S rRNA (cytosine(1402)-N(4))-methyltransferase RsmH [Fimbriimonadaceae bacterium]|nr:16S rRNA (cytosine(1402)-N(4))-methyltransferase RsmH [Fimbriimonadaceae bacterium]
MEKRHDPVMVEEILRDFNLQPGMTVVDGTLGLGGHSSEFCKRIAPSGKLIGFDWDAGMMASAMDRLQSLSGVELQFVHDSFMTMPQVLGESDVRPNAILLDLGLNSAQVDDPARGFSFLQEGPLDMRMDRGRGEPASAVLMRMSPVQIEDILKDYGDERWAKAIARKVVEHRKQAPIRTTKDLVDCVHAAIPVGAREKRIHPATRTFQALRIYVNRELDGLEEALMDSARQLSPGGVMAVLSYHSGEDRIVKHAFRELIGEGFEELHKKPLQPTDDEIRKNSRARSAKLRSLKRSAISDQKSGDR